MRNSRQAFVVAVDSVEGAEQLMSCIETARGIEECYADKENDLWIDSIRVWYKGHTFDSSQLHDAAGAFCNSSVRDDRLAPIADVVLREMWSWSDGDIKVLQLALNL